MADLMVMLEMMIGTPSNDIEAVFLYAIAAIIVIIVVKGVASLFYIVKKAF
jgi:hypothetical protein